MKFLTKTSIKIILIASLIALGLLSLGIWIPQTTILSEMIDGNLMWKMLIMSFVNGEWEIGLGFWFIFIILFLGIGLTIAFATSAIKVIFTRKNLKNSASVGKFISFVFLLFMTIWQEILWQEIHLNSIDPVNSAMILTIVTTVSTIIFTIIRFVLIKILVKVDNPNKSSKKTQTVNNNPNNSTKTKSLEDLSTLKKLYDDGAITKKEYKKKKKELLN